MFCPEDSSKNVDDASVSAPNKARRSLKTSAKVTLGIVAAVVVAGIVLFQVGKSQSSPEKAAMDYFGALQAQDWNSAYRKLDIGDSEFLTEKNFEKVQKKSAESEKIVNYAVSTVRLVDDLNNPVGYGASSRSTYALTRHFIIQYTTRGSSSSKEQILFLIKQPGKKWFFFDFWKISPEGYVTPEVTISAPADVTVSLGDIRLGSKYLVKDKDSDSKDNDNSLVTYSVKKIFSGHYTIRATSPDTEDCIRPMDFDGSIGSLVISRKDLKPVPRK